MHVYVYVASNSEALFIGVDPSIVAEGTLLAQQ
jgi:hypothetical protein